MGRSLFIMLLPTFPLHSGVKKIGICLSSFRYFALVTLVASLVASDCLAQVLPQNMPNQGNGASTQGSNSFQPETPVMTFVDPRSGQMYGRYVLYETVPVAKYEYKPVVERQYVPEWVQETKPTTQVQYVPIVTYQVQPVQAPTWNPFSAPRQYWQYVPQVQYQPRYYQINQPITYQKYVEKEVTKYVPEMVVKQERVPQFADRPLAPTTYQPGNQNGSASGNLVAQQPPPIRPVDSFNQPVGTMVSTAPSPYYASTQQPFNSASNSFTAANNGGFYGNRWGTASYAATPNNAPVNPYVNNPTPNAGLNANWNQANAMAASRSPNPFTNFLSRLGPLYGSGSIMASNGVANPPVPSTQFVPSSSGSQVYPGGVNYVASSSGGWGGTTGVSSSNPLSIPFFGNSTTSSGLNFRPQMPSYPTSNANWGLAPVDNYRDPTQSGMSSSFIR
jgi:hypothetical protein